jgi:hypothetical protein
MSLFDILLVSVTNEFFSHVIVRKWDSDVVAVNCLFG